MIGVVVKIGFIFWGGGGHTPANCLECYPAYCGCIAPMYPSVTKTKRSVHFVSRFPPSPPPTWVLHPRPVYVRWAVVLPFLHTTSVDVNVFLHPLSSKVSMLTFAITTCFSQKQTTDTLGGMEEIPNDGYGLVLTSATMYMYMYTCIHM